MATADLTGLTHGRKAWRERGAQLPATRVPPLKQWALRTFYQAKGKEYAALLLLPEASHPQTNP